MVIAHLQRCFGADHFWLFDVFEPQLPHNDFQDILITGLDYAFDDAKTAHIFRSCHKLLSESPAPGEKRLLFTLRYNDNVATKLIDDVLLPLENGLKNFVMRLRGRRTRYLRKRHGFRRSRREIMAIARREGFRARKVVYGGYGIELTRSAILNKLGFVVRIGMHIDRLVKVCNNITLIEFVIPDTL